MLSGALFPAHAGMNRSPDGAHLRALAVPRTRGDEPDIQRYINLAKSCSPHTRG